ncbi:hypothetical protein B0A49_04711 [Cryomyces minteri]|uniref:GH16 domain-containing protein n=1 Tax=Cryomyces minteri TaxID=331657 RepID=A0A4U0XQ70_9PEZI|nr:hypothetical protein B0A49_04711 [Cryomyces minteri]
MVMTEEGPDRTQETAHEKGSRGRPRGLQKTNRCEASPGAGVPWPWGPRSEYEDQSRPSKHKFQSYRLKGEYEQPWTSDKRLKRWRYNNVQKVLHENSHGYCLLVDDEFKSIDSSTWSHEVQINGFGTGSFDWTTTDPKNSFVDAEGLHIVPTLTNATTGITGAQINNGYSLNLTKAGGDGTCTGTDNYACSVASNSTLGTTIPPVRSARLTTKGKKSIKYGKIEVTAKFPKGDWLWPAIWRRMMPERDTYGIWPRSGEIDIAEARGNSVDYVEGGRDVFASTLHWGPTTDTDAYWRTTRGKAIRRTDYSQGYHTFGLIWNKDYLFTYLDSRLLQILYMSFEGKETLWQRGHFAGATENQTLLTDPWTQTGNLNTPFDQPFYLILNVAVGSQNGWFLDGKGNKPWLDRVPSAQSAFWNASAEWLPTWGKGNERGMTVKSVKMWQEGACTHP